MHRLGHQTEGFLLHAQACRHCPQRTSLVKVLVTANATSLYINIPHSYDLFVIDNFLSLYPLTSSCPSIPFYFPLNQFFLMHVNLSFNSCHYLWGKIIAIWTRMAYAGLSMERLAEAFLKSEDCKTWLLPQVYRSSSSCGTMVMNSLSLSLSAPNSLHY